MFISQFNCILIKCDKNQIFVRSMKTRGMLERHYLYVRTIGTHLSREKSLDIKMNSECFFLLKLQLEEKVKILMQPYLITKKKMNFKRKIKKC